MRIAWQEHKNLPQLTAELLLLQEAGGSYPEAEEVISAFLSLIFVVRAFPSPGKTVACRRPRTGVCRHSIVNSVFRIFVEPTILFTEAHQFLSGSLTGNSCSAALTCVFVLREEFAFLFQTFSRSDPLRQRFRGAEGESSPQSPPAGAFL